LRLPGQLSVAIPMEEVRRADGGQLHRVGITPHVELRPTVRSVRSGVDFVYDRALQWMREELSPPERRRR